MTISLLMLGALGLLIVGYSIGFWKGQRYNQAESQLRSSIEAAQKFSREAHADQAKAKEARARRSDRDFLSLFL